MNEKNAISVLKEVNLVFKKHKVVYWLDSGTLLGAVRDKKFIPWDNDIDLGIWADDLLMIKKNKVLFKDFSKRRFQIYLLEDKLILEKKGILVNISIFQLKGKKAFREMVITKGKPGLPFKALWWVLSVKYYNKTRSFGAGTFIKHFLLFFASVFSLKTKSRWTNSLSKIAHYFYCKEVVWSNPAHFFRKLSYVNFYGEKFYAPAELDKYLVFRYGSDWHIVKKSWATWKSDGAVEGK